MKFLETSQRCPTCAEELTVETLTEPSRIAKDYLNELNIRGRNLYRGCHEIVKLQQLDRFEPTCGFTPVVCANQGCGVTVNMRDQIHHESELCEFRKLKCHSCGETSKTLTDIERKMANVEKNTATNQAAMKAKFVYTEKNMERNMTEIEADVEGKFEAVNNEVKGLKEALVQGFNEMKDVLVKNDMKREYTREMRGRASGDKKKESIIVAGGLVTDSVEIFNWRQKLWQPLQSLPVKRYGATSFLYNNRVTIAGGYSDGFGGVDVIIRMNIDAKPALSTLWSESPVKLPAKLIYHSGVLHNDQLISTGGYNGNVISDCTNDVRLVLPYTVKTLSKMPEPRRGHSTEIFDGNLLIVGGRKTKWYQDDLSSVVL